MMSRLVLFFIFNLFLMVMTACESEHESDQVATEILELKNRIDDLEVQNEELKNQIEFFESNIDDMESRISDLEDVIDY